MGIDPNLAGLLSYLVGIICPILFIAMEKDNKYIRFHAMQALFLQLGMFVLWVAVIVISTVLSFMGPLAILGCLLYPIMMVVGIGYMVVAIMMMIKAFQGEYYKLPVIGDMAEKYI